MIISEKQILELMTIACNFRELLVTMLVKEKVPGIIHQHAGIGRLLGAIQDQQSEELKDIK